MNYTIWGAEEKESERERDDDRKYGKEMETYTHIQRKY